MKAAPSKTNSESTHHSGPNSGKSSFFSNGIAEEKPFFGPGFIQPKLEIGSPDDKYEREADRVAEQVMRMPDSDTPGSSNGNMLQQKPLLQCDSANSGGKQTASSEITSKISSTRGSGKPLPKETQNEMGAKIGADFSGVKIHTDNTAVQLSQDLGAKAFTVGNEIYFNKGQYNTSSVDGKRLMAHELTHVIQQSRSKLNKSNTVASPFAGFTVQKSGPSESEGNLPEDIRNVMQGLMSLGISAAELQSAYEVLSELGMSGHEIKRVIQGMLRLCEDSPNLKQVLVLNFGQEVGEQALASSGAELFGQIGTGLAILFCAVDVVIALRENQWGVAAAKIYETAIGMGVPWASIINAAQSLVSIIAPVEDTRIEIFFDILAAFDPIALGGIAVDSFVSIIEAAIRACIIGENPWPVMYALVERMNESPTRIFSNAGSAIGMFVYELFNSHTMRNTPHNQNITQEEHQVFRRIATLFALRDFETIHSVYPFDEMDDETARLMLDFIGNKSEAEIVIKRISQMIYWSDMERWIIIYSELYPQEQYEFPEFDRQPRMYNAR